MVCLNGGSKIAVALGIGAASFCVAKRVKDIADSPTRGVYGDAVGGITEGGAQGMTIAYWLKCFTCFTKQSATVLGLSWLRIKK